MKFVGFLLFALSFCLFVAAQECTDCHNCAVCNGLSDNGDGTQTVAIDVLGCKGSDISWLCCKDAGCALDGWKNSNGGCIGVSSEADGTKCDETAGAYYKLASSATYITLQLHDGRFIGNITRTNACGGIGTSCSASSGVCEVRVDLSSCPGTFVPECYSDADCSDLDACSVGVCSSGICVQSLVAQGTVCRESAGVCDVQEVCSGSSPYCPDDQFAAPSHICRAALYDSDGTTCDSTEYCTGTSIECPTDSYIPAGEPCRASRDLCDVAEHCDGVSATCPSDLRKDFGYTYKCSTTQFLCTVQQHQLGIGNGNQYFLGACGIGTARNFVVLDWPSCVSTCIEENCPNNRGLSNFAEAKCIGNTGQWECVQKVDVDESTALPYCPHSG